MTMSAAVSPAREEVLLVDLSAIYWACWHSSVNDEVSMAARRALEGVRKVCNFRPFAGVAICCDTGKSFRKDLDPQYKANRPEKDAAAVGELVRLKERLVADGYLLWEAPGFEADDVIASAVELANAAGYSAMVATADKDLMQLVKDGKCSILSTRTGDVIEEKGVAEKFGVTAPQVGDWLALVGDSSDNIKGAPGIGPKTAAALLSEHGTLRKLMREVMSNDGAFKPAVAKSLRENADQIDLARQLVGLRSDVPLYFAAIFEKREQKPLTTPQEPESMDTQDAEFEESAIAPPTPQVNHGPKGDPCKQADEQTAAPAQPQEVALSVVRGPREAALQPTSVGTAYKLAKALYESRLYQRYNNAEAIFAVIIRGSEMGLGALTALDTFHVIEGKPAPHAHLIIARAKADPDCEYFQCVETSATKATYETKHRRDPRPTRLTYTIEQASAAGLTGKAGGNWAKRPDEMLRKTCGVHLARMVYPEAALGLYAVEEQGAE